MSHQALETLSRNDGEMSLMTLRSMHDAADEIERLRGLLKEAGEALERLERDIGHNEDVGNPAIIACEYCGSQSDPGCLEIGHDPECRIYQARSVLSKIKGEA